MNSIDRNNSMLTILVQVCV